MLTLLGYMPALLLLAAAGFCIVTLRTPGPRGLWLNWVAGIGWVVLWSLPAVIAQDVRSFLRGAVTTFDALEYLQIAGFQVWVLCGGASVIEIFEATAKSLTGHRQSTMIDNWHYFAALTYAQAAIAGGLAAWFRATRGLRWGVWVIAVASLVNALMAIDWPWWGT